MRCVYLVEITRLIEFCHVLCIVKYMDGARRQGSVAACIPDGCVPVRETVEKRDKFGGYHGKACEGVIDGGHDWRIVSYMA